jgi:hypothetical protein
MFRPTFLGHPQVVQTSLKSIVHEVKIIYCDDEISFILHMPCYLLGVKVSTFGWFQVLGVGWWRRMGRGCILLWVL